MNANGLPALRRQYEPYGLVWDQYTTESNAYERWGNPVPRTDPTGAASAPLCMGAFGDG